MVKKADKVNDNRGLVFHIIHGSFVDGHGIRTTVFLKGCPLRCLWCCNPEGQFAFREIKLTVSLCNGCGKCAEVCPQHAIRLSDKAEDNKVLIDRELCDNCGHCIDVCFTGSLSFFGKYYTVDELFDIVAKDKAYYRSSGGGVTLGGGEPTYQPKFTRAFLKKCRENNIHTALDTCGYTVDSEGVKALEEADLILYDLKGFSPEEHLSNTSVSNRIILSNLNHLNEMGKDIIIRIPIIPGYTDSAKNLKSIAKLLSRLKSVERVDLIAYHEYGTIKYRELGREYELQLATPDDKHMNDIKTLFEQQGLKVQLGG